MQTITLKGYGTNIPPYEAIELGTYDSYGVEQLQIVPSHGWENLSIIASFFPPSGAEPIKVAVLSGGIIDVPPGATAKQSGKGIIVFAGYKANTQLISTNVAYNIRDHKDIASGDPVCPTPSVVDQIVNAAKSAQEDAEKAAGSAKKAEEVAASVRNDADEGKFNGEDGYSPSANVTQIENGAVISIRDKTGESTATIYNGKDGAKGDKGDTGDKGNTGAKGDKGDKGFSPTAAVTQLENGAEITITDEEGTTKATVKNGIKGDKGDRGSNGVSPTISVEDIENGHRVTIVDATGTTSVDIYNGEDGIDGKDGVQIDDAAVSEDAPWSSKHIVDMLCPPLEESGNHVVCYPVAGYPLGVKAKWEPVQEGSGTPYPAGGGKNLFNPAWMPGKTVNGGVTWTITNDGIVTANGAAAATSYYNSDYFLLPAGTYTISAMPYFHMSILNRDSDGTTIAAQSVGKPLTFTVENDIQKATLFFAASGTLDNVSAKPQIEKGATATDYAPYENIRPIKGRNSVTVERCGENLIKYPAVSRKQGIELSVDDNKLTIKGTCSNSVSFISDNIYLPDDTYTLLSDVLIPKGAYISAYTTIEKLLLNYQRRTATGKVSGNTHMLIYLEAGTYNFTVQVSLVSGTTAPTTYTPYNGQINTLTLPETVYGGEVDAVTGDGRETWKTITLDGKTNKFADAVTYWNLPQNSAVGIGGWHLNNIYSSHFYNVFSGNAMGNFIYTTSAIMTKYFPDTDTLNAYLAAQYAAGTPVQVCYKLTTPTQFTATGAQPIPALAGANTVLTDADSATVTGRADPIKRITDLEAAVASIN